MAKAKTVETLSLKPSEVVGAITALMNTDRSMFLWGPPGISKSQTAAQVASAAGMAFIDVRLSQMDPTDLRGIPYPVADEDGVRWSSPLVLPRDLDYNRVSEIRAVESVIKFLNPTGSNKDADGNKIHYVSAPQVTVKAVDPKLTAEIVSQKPDQFTVVLKDSTGTLAAGEVHWIVTGKVRAILGLEEFNSAPPSVTAAAYQLVLDRALGEYEVPEGVFIMAMGNRDTDKGITFKMATPVANRFIHVEMRPDFDDWQKWAIQKMIHPDVVGFLAAFNHHLFDFNPSTASRGFATPRSWEAVSDILSGNDDMNDIVAMGLIFGAVGEGVGVEFLEHRKHAANLPRADEILSGSLKKMKQPPEVSLSYALTTTLCYELVKRAKAVERNNGKDWDKSKDREKWLSEADNFLAFIMENFTAEICIMGAKTAIAYHDLPFVTSRMKNFTGFVKQYKDLIMTV
jgi:MoxR-like ATPase